MLRIYLALVISYVLVICAAMVFGLLVDDARSFAIHFGVGLFATIFTCFFYCVVITYFIITGKMIKQAVLKGRLEDHLIQQSQGFKGKATWLATMAMALALAAALIGAWAHEGEQRIADRAMLHMIAEFVAVGLNLVIMLLVYRRIDHNAHLVDHVFRTLNEGRNQLPSF